MAVAAKRSILEELMALAPRAGKHEFVSSAAENAYVSVMKLFGSIREHYGEADADDLEKRFINSVKTADMRKFRRGMDRIRREEDEASS